jgi:hypothetical protein
MNFKNRINMKHTITTFLLLIAIAAHAQFWQTILQQPNGAIRDFEIDAMGNLVVSGTFTSIGGIQTQNIALFDGLNWNSMGGENGFSGSFIEGVERIGNDLYAMGQFSQIAGVNSSCIAKWNGQNWSSFGGSFSGSTSGFQNNPPLVSCLAEFQGELYAAGDFRLIDGLTANSIVKWNGINWEPIGQGISGMYAGGALYVNDMIVFNDELYICGAFSELNGIQVNGIAKYNGSTWSSVDGGGNNLNIFDLYNYDGMLYAGGVITNIGNADVSNIARLNGEIWEALPNSEFNSWVGELKSFNNKLFAIGNFTMVGNEPVSHIAQFDGQSWTGLNEGLDEVGTALEIFNGRLYCGGNFSNAGNISAENIAIWSEPIQSACNTLPSNLQNGLIGHWPFCGNANDESGNGNDGTVNGATLTEDRFGADNKAFEFSGSNWITINNSILSSGLTSYSYSYWFKKYNETSVAEVIINDRSNLGYRYYSNFANNAITNGGPEGGIANSGNGSSSYVAYNHSQSLIDGAWHFVAVVLNLADSTLSIQVDGTFLDSVVFNYSSWVEQASPTFIGGAPLIQGDQQFYTGKIDDVSFWNRALTSEELQQLYTINACTFTSYDTVTIENVVTIYDTVSVSVSTTDTLIINTLITQVQPAQENTFLVYPNPAGSQITINNGNVGILGGYTMRITNSAGQEVYNQNITQTEVTLDLSNWGGNGLYVMYVVDPQGEIIAVKQIVLQ